MVTPVQMVLWEGFGFFAPFTAELNEFLDPINGKNRLHLNNW